MLIYIRITEVISLLIVCKIFLFFNCINPVIIILININIFTFYI